MINEGLFRVLNQQIDHTALPGFGGGMIPMESQEDKMRKRALMAILGGESLPADVLYQGLGKIQGR